VETVVSVALYVYENAKVEIEPEVDPAVNIYKLVYGGLDPDFHQEVHVPFSTWSAAGVWRGTLPIGVYGVVCRYGVKITCLPSECLLVAKPGKDPWPLPPPPPPRSFSEPALTNWQKHTMRHDDGTFLMAAGVKSDARLVYAIRPSKLP
jgi:hypothetical protein